MTSTDMQLASNMHLKTVRKEKTKLKIIKTSVENATCHKQVLQPSGTQDLSRTICTIRKTLKNLFTFDNPGLKSKPYATSTCGSLNMFKIVNAQTAE